MIEARKRKTDRDEVFLELTKSVCPVCKGGDRRRGQRP